MPILLLVIPVLSTLAGGALALRFRRSLLLLIALGVGLLLGAAFLDLLPEALVLGKQAGLGTRDVLGVALLSFLVFFAVSRMLDALAARVEASLETRAFGKRTESRRWIGKLGGGLMIFHSLRDGMAIGLAYAASHQAGYAVAAGIAAHDLGDGMNTVILTTGGERPRLSDYLFLLADALAPLAGGLLTAWWGFSLQTTVVLLAVAAGFFLQMATTDFVPELRKGTGTRQWILPAVLGGAGLIYAANLLVAGWR